MEDLKWALLEIVAECKMSDNPQQLEFVIEGKQYVVCVMRIRGDE